MSNKAAEVAVKRVTFTVVVLLMASFGAQAATYKNPLPALEKMRRRLRATMVLVGGSSDRIADDLKRNFLRLSRPLDWSNIDLPQLRQTMKTCLQTPFAAKAPFASEMSPEVESVFASVYASERRLWKSLSQIEQLYRAVARKAEPCGPLATLVSSSGDLEKPVLEKYVEQVDQVRFSLYVYLPRTIAALSEIAQTAQTNSRQLLQKHEQLSQAINRNPFSTQRVKKWAAQRLRELQTKNAEITQLVQQANAITTEVSASLKRHLEQATKAVDKFAR